MSHNPTLHGPGIQGLETGVLNGLDQYKIAAVVRRSNWRIGQNPSRFRDRSDDFIGFRPFSSGDDWRSVDWGTSARFERPLVRESRRQMASDHWILLDQSLSMLGSGGKKYQFAKGLVIVLAYIALGNHEPVSILSGWNGQQSRVQTYGSKSQFPQLIRDMGQIPVVERFDLSSTVSDINARMRTGGHLMIVSDFYEFDSFDAIRELLPASQWELTFLHVLSPEEVRPDKRGQWLMMDSESGEGVQVAVTDEAAGAYQDIIQRWQDSLGASSGDNQARYLCIVGDEEFGTSHINVLTDSRLVVRR